MKRGKLLYTGKAKELYENLEDANTVIHVFKNSLTALNGQKKGEFSTKGGINTRITVMLMKYLGKKGISHHLLEWNGDNEILTQHLQMIPLEVVVRNKAAGSLAKKFGWAEGFELKKPLVEFYLKDDGLGDPFVSREHIEILETANEKTLNEMAALGLKVNTELKALFAKMDVDLIDFKLEMGRNTKGELLLADEISPDTCRLWDLKTGEKLDKDRFRRDLGGIEEAYQTILERMKPIMEAL